MANSAGKLELTRGPLQGIRILDLSRATAGPYGSMLLADLGAEVIKIEPPEGGSGVSPRASTDPRYSYKGIDLMFQNFNRNKKSIVIDLRMQKGRELFYELVKKSDVVYDSFRSGVTRKLGVDYDRVKKYNSRIISCSLTGFSEGSPYEDRPAFDTIMQAFTGGMLLMDARDKKGRPRTPAIAYADMNGGAFAAHAVTLALLARERTGEGQKIEMSLLDVQLSVLGYLEVYPLNLRVIRAADLLWGAFKARDRYMVIAGHREVFWEKLCKALGRESWLNEPRYKTLASRLEHKDELWDKVEEALSTRDAAEWLKVLHESDVPCAPLNTMIEAMSDPGITGGMVVGIEHAQAGPVRIIGNPYRTSSLKEQKYAPAPEMGQHTAEVLSQLLGYTSQRLEELRGDKVIYP